MTKLSFAIAPVDVTAQGHAATVHPGEFSPVALEAIFIYGVRRWFQDAINSQAHTHKKALEAGEVSTEFDAAAAFLARLEQAKTGQITARATSTEPAFTAFDEYLYKTASDAKAAFPAIAKAIKDAKGLSTDDRKRAILAAVAALPDAQRTALHNAAQTTLSAMQALSGLKA